MGYQVNDNIVILGDLNSDLFIANNNKLKETMMLLNLAYIISKPTRIAAHSNTVFDPIIISDTMNYIYSVVLKYHQKLLITMPLWLFYNVQRVFLFHSNGKSGYMIKLITKHY